MNFEDMRLTGIWKRGLNVVVEIPVSFRSLDVQEDVGDL